MSQTKNVGPVLTYYAAVRLELRNSNPDLYPFELKIGTLVIPRCITFTRILVFQYFVVFELSPYGADRQTDRRTDGRTDGQDPYCGLLERPHENPHAACM